MDDEHKGKQMGQVIRIDDAKIKDHLGEMVRGTLEEALNAMLDAEADALCGAERYERNEARKDTRAGSYDGIAKLIAGIRQAIFNFMIIPSNMPRPKGFRYPCEIIAYAVWVYHRFAMSTADVEDLLAERGVIVSREAIRLWVNRFGIHFADCIRRDRPQANNKWHLDEVVISIRGVKHWLWRAIDANGEVLDILVQTRRKAKAARRFLRRLIARFGKPRVVVTDKLRSYVKPIRKLAPDADHRAHKGLNNKIEVSHKHTRKRDRSSLNHPGRLKGSCPRMIRSTSSSAPTVISSPPIHTATPAKML